MTHPGGITVGSRVRATGGSLVLGTVTLVEGNVACVRWDNGVSTRGPIWRLVLEDVLDRPKRRPKGKS